MPEPTTAAAPTHTRRAACVRLLAACGAAAGPTRHALAAGARTPDATPDVSLLDATGRSVRWRSEVLRDAPVVINFIFTTCTTLCPTSSVVMAALQDGLKGAPVLVSLSVDPLTDTPQRLSRFAQPYAPGPRWRWLTGAPGQVFALLDALDAGTGGDPQSHAPLWLIGRSGHGPWQRLYGTPAMARFQAGVDALR